MIADQPIINNVSYNNSPRIEFRVDNFDPILSRYQNLSPDQFLDELMEKATLNPLYLLRNKSDINGYQIVKKSQDLNTINENIKKSLYSFRMPSEEEAEWQRNKFLPQNNYFQIPFVRIRF